MPDDRPLSQYGEFQALERDNAALRAECQRLKDDLAGELLVSNHANKRANKAEIELAAATKRTEEAEAALLDGFSIHVAHKQGWEECREAAAKAADRANYPNNKNWLKFSYEIANAIRSMTYPEPTEAKP